jgi:hypothetical protein
MLTAVIAICAILTIGAAFLVLSGEYRREAALLIGIFSTILFFALLAKARENRRFSRDMIERD